MKLIIATSNDNKVKEFVDIFKPYNIEVLGLHDLNINVDIVEDGKTYEENAAIKANTICKLLNTMVIADDAGLSINALDGFPGIYSARFMEDHPFVEKCNELIYRLKDKSDRSATFNCAIALAIPNKETKVFLGQIKGKIADKYTGKLGFGYDPIFIIDGQDKTFGELGPEYKNTVSHRYLAVNMLLEYMKKEGLINA